MLPPQALGPSVALGAGLPIGLERERRKGRNSGRAAAGIRSLTPAAPWTARWRRRWRTRCCRRPGRRRCGRVDGGAALTSVLLAITTDSVPRSVVVYAAGGSAFGTRVAASLALSTGSACAVAAAAGGRHLS